MREFSTTEVVDVKYWKEVTKEIGKLTTSPWSVMLLMHNSVELQWIMDFLKELPYAKRIVYISATRTCKHIQPYLKEPYFNENSRVFIIDCVSPGVFGEQEKPENCIFVHAPQSLEKMLELFGKCLKKINPNLLILDSLSQLLEYSSISEGEELLNLFSYFKKRSSESRKFILLQDSSHGTKNLPTSYVDIILKIEGTKNLVFWKD